MLSAPEEPRHKLGGAAGGLFAACQALGHGVITLLVGSRLAADAGVAAYIFVGGALTCAVAGGAIAALIWGADAFRAVALGVILGAGAGLLLSMLLLVLAKHPAFDDTSRPPWQQKLREAGISAHEIDKVAEYDAKTFRFYEKQFRLNRDDGMSVREAHDAAVVAADRNK
jgi:hypothetical protein